MGLTTIKFTDEKEELALARYRESQQAGQTTDTASPLPPASPAPSAQSE